MSLPSRRSGVFYELSVDLWQQTSHVMEGTDQVDEGCGQRSVSVGNANEEVFCLHQVVESNSQSRSCIRETVIEVFSQSGQFHSVTAQRGHVNTARLIRLIQNLIDENDQTCA